MSKNNNKQVKKGKLSLQELFDSYVNECDSSDQDFLKKNAMLLILSLNGAEVKANKTGADTLTVNNGYLSHRDGGDKEIVVPFMVSGMGWGVQPNEQGKMQLVRFDNLGQSTDDEELKEEYKNVSINWKFNLSDNLIKEILGYDKSQPLKRAWNELKNYIFANGKLQIQMLVVKSVKLEDEPGRMQTLPLLRGQKVARKAYTIYLPKNDIKVAKLVTPSPEYLSKVDRPPSVMERLGGTVVQTDGVENNKKTESVNIFDKIAKDKKLKKEAALKQEQLLEESRIDSVVKPEISSESLPKDEWDMDNDFI